MNVLNIVSDIKTFITDKHAIIVLIVIVLIGAWLCFDGAAWGLPLRLHPDEWVVVDNAMDMANNHRFEITSDFNRPDHTEIKMEVILFWGLRHTIQAVKIWQLSDDDVASHIALFENVPDAVQKLPPKPQLFMLNCMVNHQIPFGRANDSALYVAVGRALSALFGVACMILAWLIGKQIHEKVGLIGAALFALSPVIVKHSHYITPEIYLTAFTLAMTYFSILYIKNPKISTLFCACACVALAFCAKYTALFSFPIIITAIICAEERIKSASVYKLVFKKMYYCFIAIMIFGCGVFIISPTLLLDFPSVYVDVMYEAKTSHAGADGLGYWGNLFFYLKCYAQHVGVILSAISLWGILLCWRADKKIFILLIWGLLYAPIISILALHWDRWGVPFYAFAFIFASIGVRGIIKWLLGTVKAALILHQEEVPKVALVMALIVILLLVISFVNISVSSIAKSMYFSSATDTRNASVDYVAEIGATKENTVYEGYTPMNPTYPATIFNEFENGDISKPINPNLKYIIISSSMYDRFYAEPDVYSGQVAFYESLKANSVVLRQFQPVDSTEYANEILNIGNGIRQILRYAKGDYSGPNIIFYQY